MYNPRCPRCVELRGHLPPGERDRPPERPQVIFTNRRRSQEAERNNRRRMIAAEAGRAAARARA